MTRPPPSSTLFPDATLFRSDLKELEERYAGMNLPYMVRRVIDDYIACLESKSERYADLSYVRGMGDAIFLLKNIGALGNPEALSVNAE